MTDLRSAYYDIRRRNDELKRFHSIMFSGSTWQSVRDTEQLVGCDGYRVVVESNDGIVAQVLDPKGKAVASYK